MGTLTLSIILLGSLWAMAYFGASLMIGSICFAALLIVLQYLGAIGWSALLIWPLFLAVAIPLQMPKIRQKFITVPAFAFFRKVLPPMSETEKAAIESGNTWWEAKLFQGKPQWHSWMATSFKSLSEEENSFLNNQVEELLSMIDDWSVVQEAKDLPDNVWEFLKKEKFFSLIIPKEYGGLDFSAAAQSAIIAKIATHSVSAAVTTMVPNSLGPAELLLKYGTDKQKEYYLPRLADGREIPCFGLTSTVAGSDAGSIQDKGVVCNGTYNGKTVLGIKLNWEKRYITLAPVASVLGLAFKLYDPDRLLGDEESLGITLCLIPTNTPGVEIGHRHIPLNQAFMNGPTRGRDVFIPIDWIIGGRERVGQGWRMLMECLAVGRGISLPALSTSTVALSYRATGAYARLREQFRTPIGMFEGVQEAMANIGGYTYMIEATRQVTAGGLDAGEESAIVSAIAKYHMTELGRKAVNHAMDVHGGKTIISGPTNYLGNIYHVQPISITVEGANILTRSLMIYGQGAIRCHPHIVDEMQAASDYEKDAEGALKAFDKAFFGHVRYFIQNLAKGLFLGLSHAWLVLPPHRDDMSRYFQKMTWMSTALAFTSDVAMMVLGGKLKKAERLSARLGDVLSHLYLGTSVLKYYYDNGAKEIDKAHVHWSCQYVLHQCQEALYEFYANFPVRWVGWLMRVVMFPLGGHCSLPKDKLSGDVAHSMMEDSELRERLTKHVYQGESAKGIMMLEQAFKKFFDVSPLLAKINEAISNKSLPKESNLNDLLKAALDQGIIDTLEKKQIIEFEKLRFKVIAVDEFSSNYFAGKSQWKTKNITLKAERFSS